MPLVGGMFFKDADPALVSDLDDRGLLFSSGLHEHSYPHCWRCHTPLIYYAQPSWFIRTTAIKDQMLAENEKTSWHPETIKDGRYGEWLRNNVDWALSRTRYWGTPLPLWVCPRAARDPRRVAGRAVRAGRPRPDRAGSAPALRGRGGAQLPPVRKPGAPGARGDRRLVRLGIDAVRAARGAAAP